MEYPKIQFKEIPKIHNLVYVKTYICLLPQRYERIIKKIKSLLIGRFNKEGVSHENCNCP